MMQQMPSALTSYLKRIFAKHRSSITGCTDASRDARKITLIPMRDGPDCSGEESILSIALQQSVPVRRLKMDRIVATNLEQ